MVFPVVFEAAAPEMFTEFTAAPTELGAFDELTAKAAPAVAETLGSAELASSLSPFASQAAGAYGGPGITQAQLAGDVVSGGAGAGGAGINAAQVAQQQAKAVDIANSGIDRFAGTTNASFPSPTAGPTPPASSAMNMEQGIDRFANTTNASFPTENPPTAAQSAMMNAPVPTTTATASSTQSGFMKGVSDVLDWADKHPFKAGIASYLGAQKLGLLNQKQPKLGEDPYKGGILQNYKMSPNFQGRFANPADFQYTPKVYNMAEGGIAQIGTPGTGPVEAMSNANAVGANTGYPMADISKGAYATPWQTPISRNVISDTSDTGVNPITGDMSFASGGIASYRAGGNTLSEQLDYFEKLRQGQTASPPSGKTSPHGDHGDVGIYYDLDPDTRSLDPVTAAQVRMAKVNKRANMQTPSMPRPTPMGQLNMVPVTMKANPNAPDMSGYANGGIMSLGGYADGGNPRLLKGPGDGMSDNIPATIANKQPARLADGEFVVPADVVSHLGNGSTDAGAKKLHDMMTNVRKARTGNPKQGKQINPDKFVPK